VDTDIYRVPAGTEVRLADWPTADDRLFPGGKTEGEGALGALNERLADLQQMLYASSSHRMLVVLQGMDTSGKDGTIKHVFKSINPLGVSVANFKRPSDTELAHDYLWRVHAHTPPQGHITIFNRSHYEDVLPVRVHALVPAKVWLKRYRHLREFERMMADEGVTIHKFFLHISKEEQRVRLQERIDNPAKHWKFEHGDLTERKHWDDYQDAYADAIAKTSTDWAPWHIIPSDKKWYRNLVISRILVDALEGLHMTYPEPDTDLSTLTVD
jgi:PPK2 family polyphosphate:nucleotide phosphotransferase